MDELIERLRSVNWDVTDDGDRMPDDPARKCVFVDMRPDEFEALLRETAAALEAAREDAERYQWLRTKLMAANFHPEDPNGLDLGEGVALIFLLPSDSHVTPDLDWTIDQARGKENGND